jgi:hypothetical protein
MTQSHRCLAWSALLLVLSVTTAWAQDKKPQDKPTVNLHFGVGINSDRGLQLSIGSNSVDEISCCEEQCCVESDCSGCGTCSSCSKSADKASLITRIHSVRDLVTPVAEAKSGCCKDCATCAASPCCKDCSPSLEQQLITLITNTVKPQSWATMGGSGTIEFYPIGCALVVNQPADVQEQIDELLTALTRLAKHKTAARAPATPSKTEGLAILQLPFSTPEWCEVPVPFFTMPMQPSGDPVAHAAAIAPAAFPLPAYPQPSVREFANPICPACPACPAAAEMTGVPCPEPLALPPVPASFGVTQAVATAPAKSMSSSWHVRAVSGHKDKLEIDVGSGMHMTCTSLELTVPGSGCVKFTAHGKQVCVSGPSVEATAQAVSSSGSTGCIALDGHVWLQYQKGSERAEVTAERVVLGLADGKLEVQPLPPVKPPEHALSFWFGMMK